MARYILLRLLHGVIVIIIVSILVFLIMRLLPGDPVLLYIDRAAITNVEPATLAQLRAEFGLDKPLYAQYLHWVNNILHGDLGRSIFTKLAVSSIAKQRFPVTAYLGILSLLLSSIVAISAGIICALKRGGWLDTLVSSLTNIGVSAPIFWLGILLIYLFGVHLKWLPIYGYTSPFTDFWLSTRQIIMPVICLSVVSISFVTRQTRSSILEIVRNDYVRTAWAKGLREQTIVTRHVLRNSLIPIATLIGLQVSSIISGSVLVETVFNIPGVGRMMVNALFSHDYPIIQGGAFLIASFVVVINLLVDISYGWLDPRIRYR
jgi:peptide/nickel transport system permease protein